MENTFLSEAETDRLIVVLKCLATAGYFVSYAHEWNGEDGSAPAEIWNALYKAVAEIHNALHIIQGEIGISTLTHKEIDEKFEDLLPPL